MQALFALLFLFGSAGAAQDLWLEPRATAMPALKAAPFVLLRDGSVLTVVGNDIYITGDDGKSWSSPRPVFPSEPGIQISNERTLFRTRDGVLLLAFMNLANRRWGWDDQKNEPIADVKLDVWVARSLDEGQTWQDARLLQKGYCGAIRQMIQTKSGRIVLAAQNFVYNPGHSVTITYASDDQGLTWRASNSIDLGGRGHHDGAIEATLTERKDGTLWMLLRTNWDRFWEAISDDGGHYWRLIRPTAIGASSSPGYLIRVASGRLMLAWNQLYPEGKSEYLRRSGSFSEAKGSWNREELSIAFSEDDGAHWSKPVVVARKPKAWLSYPWIFERRPGELWITTMQGELRFTVREADFTAKRAKVVAFGDSLTALRRGVVTYSDLISKLLSLEVINRGVPGNTSAQARARFDRDVLAVRPDLVIIQLGTNDSAVDVWKTPPATAPRVSVEDFRANLVYFLQALRSTNAKVILMTPSRLRWTPKLWEMYGRPPYDPSSDAGFNVILDLYADVVRGVAARERVPLVDAAAAVQLDHLPDGMHPDSQGHRAVADLLAPVIARELASR